MGPQLLRVRSIAAEFTKEISYVYISARTLLRTSSWPDTDDGSRYSTTQISQFEV